jgi:hypothetical protein
MLKYPFYIGIPLPYRHYTFTLLFPKPSIVQLQLRSFGHCSGDRAVKFHTIPLQALISEVFLLLLKLPNLLFNPSPTRRPVVLLLRTWPSN